MKPHPMTFGPTSALIIPFGKTTTPTPIAHSLTDEYHDTWSRYTLQITAAQHATCKHKGASQRLASAAKLHQHPGLSSARPKSPSQLCPCPSGTQRVSPRPVMGRSEQALKPQDQFLYLSSHCLSQYNPKNVF